MSNLRFRYSPISFGISVVAVLVVSYIGLIAVVMSYATLTVEFSQSVRNDEAVVARLESRYLAAVAKITKTDYGQIGYEKPRKETFVPAKSGTALR